MNKKGAAPLIIILILGALLLSFFVIDVAKRECNANKDCSKNSYCGSDYTCHEFPKEIIVKEYAFIIPSIILGIALIASAYIFKGGKLPTIKWK
jgi:hypothetical protein